MVHLGDDPRFDFARRFAAKSSVDLRTACDSLRFCYGDQYALPEFCFDAEKDGEDLWSWAESRSDFLGIALTVIVEYHDPAKWTWMWGAPDEANYHINVFWNSAKVSHDEARKINDVLSEVLGCPLIPLPRQYFA